MVSVTQAPAADARRLIPARIRSVLPVTVSFLIFFGIWEVLGRTLNLLVLPPVTAILKGFWGFVVDGTLFKHLLITLITLFVGMVIAAVVGITVGVLMGLYPRVEDALDVYVNAAMAAPLITFVPVFIMLFGLGYPTRIATVVVYALFPIIVNSFSGIRSVDPSLTEMARSFGATERQITFQVRLRGAFPYLLAAVRLGTGRGIKGVISGEVLVTVVGLGGLVNQYGTAFSMDKLYALIFFIVALALLIIRGVEGLSRKLARQ